MEARYNIYFEGQLLEGQDMAGVRARMARLFKADAATLDKLFSGRSQLVKRDCDKATALKYKQAMEQAGAVPVIKRVDASAAAPAQPAATTTMTAAERIAALAAAPDLMSGDRTTAPAEASAPVDSAAEPASAGAPAGELRLTPSGTAVLQPQERQAPRTSTVVAPELEVDSSGQRLSEPPAAAPPPPDTSHLSTAAAGELLPTLPSDVTPLAPDTSALDLAPAGGDFSDCAGPDQAAPELDLSAIDLAPAGADVLEPQYRRKHDEQPPATDHLSLKE